MMERHFSGLLDRRKYHTDHPEENDVISGLPAHRSDRSNQNLRSYPASQVWRDGHSAEENQVSSVSSSCLKCVHPHFSRPSGISFATTTSLHSVTVICRDTVSPPELSGNTPVTDVLQPVQIDLCQKRSGTKFSSFFSELRSPVSPSPASLQTTAVLIIGSTVVLQRSCVPTLCDAEQLLPEVPVHPGCYHGFSCLHNDPCLHICRPVR